MFESRPNTLDEVSTGTTIMAWNCKDGVVMAADSRTSTGTFVSHRFSDKIAQVASHIFVARCGSAADTQTMSEHVRYYLQSLR
jgi:20S proteasome subunit beta 1